MPIIQGSEFSATNAPYVGVLPRPHVTALGGETYKYASRGGSRISKKQKQKQKEKQRTRRAKQNRRSRRTRYNR
jgi:hypothetical protein